MQNEVTKTEQEAWRAGIDEGRSQMQSVAVPDERAAFEQWLGIKPCGAAHDFGWDAWKARAALAAIPAEVECEAETVERILNKGEQLENRAYWLSRPANINQPNPPADANHGRAYCETKAAAPVVLPEPVTWLIERSAFRVSPHGQDAESNEWLEEAHEPGEKGSFPVYTEQQVRALLATGGQAQAVERGEVLVTVSGFTGSGTSAIAGEIEILCRALGLQVEWPDGDSEKNMTHADWTAALEQYKPRVHIVEQNIPFAAMKGMSK